MNTFTITSPDSKHELGVVKNANSLYAGYITNTGVNKQWVIEYDDFFSLDENLQYLYELIESDYNK